MSDISDWEWDSAPVEMVEMGYEDYLNRLFESMQSDDNDTVDTITGMDFCGCDTCCTRETFAYLMPRFIDLFQQGYIRSVKEVAAP